MHTKGIDLLIIMNEKTTKRQHYILQFYLKNFTDDSNKLWVYDRLRKKFFKNSPKDICCEKNLYETLWEDVDSRLGEFVLQNQMENKFAQQEGIYNFLLKRIINICTNTQNRAALICNKDEKRILAGFVANLFLRNP